MNRGSARTLSAKDQGVAVMRHKTDPKRLALRLGADLFVFDPATMLYLAAAILGSLKAGGHPHDPSTVAIEDESRPAIKLN